ncbi:MAG: M20 family metallopeptidase [Acidibacillus sp.]|nr:M20 family metallopeptidase [Acidibacillus sp.]
MAMSVVLNDLESRLNEVHQDVVKWRRYLHENPELSFEEVATSQFVYDTLLTFQNLEISRPTKTSVMARLKGAHPGKVIALRADMDALPIHEENEFSFISKTPGKMHACGHDGHTAVLLGVAKVLSQMQSSLSGEVRFLFQHAEELFPGGAQEMVHAGVLDGVDLVLGAHLWAGLHVGTIAVRSGPLMAAPDTFRITIVGKGGHAAIPQQTVDSIAVGAQVVTNLQHIVSRAVDPLTPIVVSVTTFIAGTADNVIPEVAELTGTVRTFDESLRKEAPILMERIIKGVTEAHGATYQFAYKNGYRPVINDAEVTAVLESCLIETFGEDVVQTAEQTMGGEDFSAYQQVAPGTFFFIGAGNPEEGITAPHHHPRFTVDERSLPMGVKAFVATVLKLLTQQSN